MVYQCMICGAIHFTEHAAELCCPTTKAIPDQNVVMCWRCRGQGWLNCACKSKGIWLAKLIRLWDSLPTTASLPDAPWVEDDEIAVKEHASG